MSYCRWSSDDFRCDLYIYESMSGFELHIAGARHMIDRDALPPDVSILDDVDAWGRRHQMLMEMLDDAELVPIELPHAGEWFLFETGADCADKVEELIGLGYNVPADVVGALRDDA